MSKCLVSGSFDPITNGHLDIIERATSKFDEVVVGVFINEQKQYAFDLETRIKLCKTAVKHLSNVIVISSSGMVVDICREMQINAIVRGFRNNIDYKYETEMAIYNYAHSGVMTYLIPAKNEFLNVSSSLVRQYLKNHIYDKNANIDNMNLHNEIFNNTEDKQNGFDEASVRNSLEKCLPKSVFEEIRRIKNA